MAIDFPGSPTNGQTYDYNNVTYEYDGTKWVPQINAGAQGSVGAQGTQGIQGPQGTTGVQGTTGAQGATGPSTTINAANDTSDTSLFPVMVTAAGSNQTAKVTTTKLDFNASSGTLSATAFVGDGSGLTGVSSLDNIIDSGGGCTVTGELTVDNDLIVGGTITELSSIRYKENVSSLVNSLSLINQLRGVEYNKIGSRQKEQGLIAEEVHAVIPQAVALKGGDPDGIHYTRLIPHLVESIKLLTKRIEELENG